MLLERTRSVIICRAQLSIEMQGECKFAARPWHEYIIRKFSEYVQLALRHTQLPQNIGNYLVTFAFCPPKRNEYFLLAWTDLLWTFRKLFKIWILSRVIKYVNALAYSVHSTQAEPNIALTNSYIANTIQRQLLPAICYRTLFPLRMIDLRARLCASTLLC